MLHFFSLPTKPRKRVHTLIPVQMLTLADSLWVKVAPAKVH